MTKDEAQREAMRRWRELPIMNRQTHKQARDFSEVLAPALPFHTMGSRQRIIEAWLVRDIEERDSVAQDLAARRQGS
jgi:hypothetical protein